MGEIIISDYFSIKDKEGGERVAQASSILYVNDFLDRVTPLFLDKEALVDKSRRMTYREIQREVHQLADALLKAGLKPQDRVGVCLPNWHETVLLYFAVTKIGATIVPFNPKYRLNEVQFIIKNSDLKMLFTNEELIKNVGIDLITRDIPKVVTVRFAREGLATFEQFLSSGEVNRSVDQYPLSPEEDLFCVLYTSGTTGVPKGVMLTHSNITQSTINIARFLRCTPEDVFLIAAPIYHIFGMLVNLFAAIYSQAKMVLLDTFTPQDALALIEKERVTVHNGVPTMYIMELNHPDLEKYDLSSLRVGMAGGAPCSPETVKAIKEKLKMQFSIGYGISEAGSLTNTPLDSEDEEVYKTLGKPLEGVEIKIVDDERREVAVNVVGEIAVRSHGVMKGYLNNPEQTRQVLDEEGWFYTGDLGKIDERGYLHFVGRKKEMIIRGGFNVYPLEVEECLLKHPSVLNAAVFGIPDEVKGEQVCAAIKLKNGASLNEEEIKGYLKQYIAPYKVPGVVLFVDELPLTPSGKIQKTKLKEQVLAQLKG